MEDIMTDKQFKTILEMFGMILDGCKDIEEAKEKVQKLLEEQKISLLNRLKEKDKGGRACHRSPIYKQYNKSEERAQGPEGEKYED